MEESAGGSICWQRCQEDGSLCAIGNFQRGGIAPEIRLHPTGMSGIDFNRRVLEFKGQGRREHVQRGFRPVVTETAPIAELGCRIGIQAEATQDAGDIDNACGIALAQQREQQAGQGPGLGGAS